MTMDRSGSARPSRRRWYRVGAAIVLAGSVIVACTPEGGGTGPGSTTVPSSTTTTPLGDEPFTVVLVGDSEARMRGNTDAEVAAYVANLAAYRTSKVAYFDYDGGTHRIDPELVVLAGDISADRGTSIEADLPLWEALYANGIVFIAGFGNHDWDPKDWSDGPGYSLAGHLSNESTKAFTRETYRRSALLTPEFTYRELGQTSVHGPVTFASSFRGVGIANFNTFLYQPSYYYPEGWPLSCNVLGGGAGCETFVSAESQIAAMEQALPAETDRTVLFLQHYPLTTGEQWWSDYEASGTTVAQKKGRLLGLAAKYDHSAILAGHNHVTGRYTHTVAGRTIPEYVAPYFGGDGGEDPTRGGGFLALLVSPTEGILEVKTVPGGI